MYYHEKKCFLKFQFYTFSIVFFIFYKAWKLFSQEDT